MRLYDISRRLTSQLAVYPGDTPFTLERQADLRDGDPYTLSTIKTTLHAGTHADAPCHFLADGAGVGELPLESFCGPARVIERIGDGPLSAEEIDSWQLDPEIRCLVRSRTRIDPAVFPEKYAHLSEPAALLLVELGIPLFGIDSPSVDSPGSSTYPAHQVLLRAGVAILENLDLTGSPPGTYELMAFPLPIAHADGSPVRAVLRGPITT